MCVGDCCYWNQNGCEVVKFSAKRKTSNILQSRMFQVLFAQQTNLVNYIIAYKSLIHFI